MPCLCCAAPLSRSSLVAPLLLTQLTHARSVASHSRSSACSLSLATNFDVDVATRASGMSGNVMILIASLVVFREYSLLPRSASSSAVVGAARLVAAAQARVAEDRLQLRRPMLCRCSQRRCVFWAGRAQSQPIRPLHSAASRAGAACAYLLAERPLRRASLSRSARDEPYVTVLQELARVQRRRVSVCAARAGARVGVPGARRCGRAAARRADLDRALDVRELPRAEGRRRSRRSRR